jgi:predicted transcriptional regulator
MVNLESFQQASLDQLDPSSVVPLAQEGHFRSIAYWLNVHLVPQGIYACVSSAPQPGYLLVLVEFQRIPDADRLNRFICHRLCKLNSSIIQGVRIVTRLMGAPTPLWDRSFRLVSAVQRQQRQRRSNSGAIALSSPQPSALERVQRSTAEALFSANLLSASLSRELYRTGHAVYTYLGQVQFQDYLSHPQARLMLKSALMAFLLGCGLEVIHSTATSLLQRPEIAQTRSDTVQTALEPLKVTSVVAADPNDPTVTLTFSGDSASSAVSSESISRATSRTSDRPVDVAFASLDTLPTASEDEEAELLEPLKASGVDVVNLANPQIVERDATILTNTIRTLEKAGIRPIGAGRNQVEARRPEILEVKGQRLAYLAYSDSDFKAAEAWQPGVNPGLADQVAADILTIRDQVDWVIVNYRWNQDLEPTVADWQKELAHYAIDQGADLVVGHHADVLQGGEIYHGRAIAYSLGNFIFDGSASGSSQEDYDTAVLKVSLAQGKMRLELLPVEVNQSKPQIVRGEKAAKILRHIQRASDEFEEPLVSPTVLQVRSPSTETSPTPADDAAPVEASNTPNTLPETSVEVTPTVTDPTPSVKSSTTSAVTDPSSSFISEPEPLPSGYEGIQLNRSASPTPVDAKALQNLKLNKESSTPKSTTPSSDPAASPSSTPVLSPSAETPDAVETEMPPSESE